mmetsp:Transcript_17669/g.38553  ORF Transcript_17669/g.38553 Transcript_17669/m.38553 type:complete len:299 (+) Transcript_17669:166-1062(+)
MRQASRTWSTDYSRRCTESEASPSNYRRETITTTLPDGEDSDVASEASSTPELDAEPHDRVLKFRPAVRVRLATGLHPDLYTAPSTKVDPRKKVPNKLQEMEAMQSALLEQANVERLPQLQLERARRDSPARKDHPRWNPGRRVLVNDAINPHQSRHRFGAWYLPAKTWRMDKTSPLSAWADRDVDRHGSLDKDKEQGAEQAEKKVNADSYSGKAFKAYIQRHGLRVPRYLEAIEALPAPEYERRPSQLFPNTPERAPRAPSSIHSLHSSKKLVQVRTTNLSKQGLPPPLRQEQSAQF